MASDWNGKALRDNYTNDAGYYDDGALKRTLRYVNEIQRDIASGGDWPNLVMKLKKRIKAGSQHVDVSPQIPEAPTVQTSAEGALTAGKKCRVKVTFVVFDEDELEYSSIESEPSPASAEVTPADENLKLLLTNIPTYDGSSSILPNKVHRRIYLKQGDEDYKLVGTIADNDTNTYEIEADPTSTIAPPEHSMVEHLTSDDISILTSSMNLKEETIDAIEKYDPGMTAKGIPRYYARITNTKILLYPRPATDTTISYWVKRRPSRIFAEEDRAIQLDRDLENVLDAGINWKWMKFKQDAEWTNMLEHYKQLKSEAKAEKVKRNGKVQKIKVVC